MKLINSDVDLLTTPQAIKFTIYGFYVPLILKNQNHHYEESDRNHFTWIDRLIL